VKPRHRRRAFVDLTSADYGPRPFGGAAGALLGRLDEATLRTELQGAGILDRLAAKGHADLVLDLDESAGEHRLRIFDRGGRESLVDLRVSENAVVLPEDASDTDSGVLSVLTITWLSLQDPGAPFTADKPRLPGQRHPGLGVGRQLIARLLAWAGAWGKDGLVNLPMYFHNAALYAAVFDFVSPLRQGRFEALRRDLAHLPLADASAAVTEERVVAHPGGQPFHWEAGEMLAPLTDRAKAHAASPGYRRGVEAARESVRFALG
jgi:GNAT superfamily N-acetyltransferase